MLCRVGGQCLLFAFRSAWSSYFEGTFTLPSTTSRILMLKKILDFRGATGSPLFLPPLPCPLRQSVVRKQAKKLGKGSLLNGAGYWGRKRGGPLLPSNVHRGIGTFSESRPPRRPQLADVFFSSRKQMWSPAWGHSPRLVGCEQEQPAGDPHYNTRGAVGRRTRSHCTLPGIGTNNGREA